MRHLAAAAVEDDRLAVVFALLAADLREEGGEAVVVVHRPAVERMVVALGALDAHAHEDLGDVLGRLQRVASRSGRSWSPGCVNVPPLAPSSSRTIWSSGTLLAICSVSQLEYRNIDL